jgi:hypothetical protein
MPEQGKGRETLTLSCFLKQLTKFPHGGVKTKTCGGSLPLLVYGTGV